MANSYIKNLEKILPIIQLLQHSNYFDFLEPLSLWIQCYHSCGQYVFIVFYGLLSSFSILLSTFL